MDLRNYPRIFVIGFAGSDRRGAAEKLAKELNYQLIDLDREGRRPQHPKNLYDDGGT